MVIALLLATSVIFVFFAFYFSRREAKITQELQKKNKILSQKLYELSLLDSVTEKMGYALDISAIAENIAVSVEEIFELSTVSYAVAEENTIKMRMYKKENVGEAYLDAVKRIMLTAMYSIESELQGLRIDLNVYSGLKETKEAVDGVPRSYFNIPIVVGEKLHGIITISSHKPNLYAEEEMSLLYKIVGKATRALGHLEEVVVTENAKAESLIENISSGALLVLFGINGPELSLINPAARHILLLEGRVSIEGVSRAFGTTLNLKELLGKMQTEGKEQSIDEATINSGVFKIFVHPVRSTGGYVIGAVITMQDITVEKDLVKVRENFTNMVVHELRTPLTSIKGAAGILEKGNSSPEESKKLINNIYRSTSRLLQDVSDLLDASKIDAGKFSLLPVASDLNAVIRREVDEIDLVAREKNITIKVDLDDRIPQFEFDPERIRQVIANLLSNSIKFTRDQGEIIVGNAKKDDIVEVFIKDNGIGIDQDKIPLLFTKYEQVSAESHGAGTGLGLYISKGIVRSHGGQIWIESEKEIGTTIRFTLPIIGQHQEIEKEPIQAQPIPVVN